jgi:hypothetical protein
MSIRRNIGILVALVATLQATTIVVAQPSDGHDHHGGYYGNPYYGAQPYYAPYYNNYGYRGYAPRVGYGHPVALGIGIGVAAGALLGGLLARPHGHLYE